MTRESGSRKLYCRLVAHASTRRSVPCWWQGFEIPMSESHDGGDMKMRTKLMQLACVISTLIGTPAWCADSWQGLRFGMTVEEAKAVLSATGLTIRLSSEANAQEGEQDWEAKQNDYKIRLLFSFKLHLQSERLESVHLCLDDTKIIHDSSVEKPILAKIANEAIFAALVGKYGKPATQRGFCGDVPTSEILRGSPKCEASWSADGQSISYSWDWLSRVDKLYLFVTYKAQTSGL
jgi:hypothetical protein